MANSKVVGKLLIDIEARTGQMETSLAAATNKLDKFNNSTRAAIKGLTGFDIGNLGKSFLKFTLLLDGVRSVLNSLANAIKDIWTNADELRKVGIISPEAAATIEDAQIKLSQAMNTAKRWGAEGLSFLLDMGSSIAIRAQNIAATFTASEHGLGALFGRVQKYQAPEVKATTDDDRAIAADIVKFHADINRLERERGKLIKEASASTLVGVERAKELAAIMERTNTAADAAKAKGSTVKSLELDVEARKTGLEVARLLAAEEKQAAELRRQWALSQGKTDRATLSDNERLVELYQKMAELKAAGAGGTRLAFDPESGRSFEVMTEADKLALKNLIDGNNQVNAILERRRTQMDNLREIEKGIAETIEERGQQEFTTRQRLALVDSQILALRVKASQLGQGGLKDPEAAVRLGQEILTKEKAKNALLMEQKALYKELGQTIAQTAADSILQLNKLSDVLKNVAAAIAQVIIQRAIIAPIAGVIGSSLFGMFGGASAAAAGTASNLPAASSIAPFKAVGGPVMAGRPYVVGEQGQELFTPSTSGMITTNGDFKASQSRSSSEPGLVYSPVYNITSGVTANELRPILRQHAEQVRGSIAQDLARGGRRAAQFGG